MWHKACLIRIKGGSMEEKANKRLSPFIQEGESQTSRFGSVAEKMFENIYLACDKWIISGELQSVYREGIQYYDLKKVSFISNAGVAKLILLFKLLLKEGIEVRFINVSEKIKAKIRSMGLDHVLICS
jgi:hypothetical protein